MAMQDKRSRIDARWQTLQPGWGKDHSSELRPLYELLQDDEEIEALVSCTWGPGSVFREGASRMDRMRRNKGVVLVTRERVVMLKGASFAGLPTNRGSHAAVDAAAGGKPEVRSSPSGIGTSW